MAGVWTPVRLKFRLSLVELKGTSDFWRLGLGDTWSNLSSGLPVLVFIHVGSGNVRTVQPAPEGLLPWK